MTTLTQELPPNPAAQPRKKERLRLGIVISAFESVPNLLQELGKCSFSSEPEFPRPSDVSWTLLSKVTSSSSQPVLSESRLSPPHLHQIAAWGRARASYYSTESLAREA